MPVRSRIVTAGDAPRRRRPGRRRVEPGRGRGAPAGVSGWEPQGVAVVAGGSRAILITDARNDMIWRYNPTTLQLKLYAGVPDTPGNADGIDTRIRFGAPQEITVGSDGLTAAAEPTLQRVRLRDPGSGTWSTVGVA